MESGYRVEFLAALGLIDEHVARDATVRCVILAACDCELSREDHEAFAASRKELRRWRREWWEASRWPGTPSPTDCPALCEACDIAAQRTAREETVALIKDRRVSCAAVEAAAKAAAVIELRRVESALREVMGMSPYPDGAEDTAAALSRLATLVACA